MKTWGIIGALFIVASAVLGFFTKFENADIVQIALGAFGLCAIINGAVRNDKAKGLNLWQIIVVIVLAIIGGVLCCIGGYNDTVIAQIAGAVTALLAVIFGIVSVKKPS